MILMYCCDGRFQKLLKTVRSTKPGRIVQLIEIPIKNGPYLGRYARRSCYTYCNGKLSIRAELKFGQS